MTIHISRADARRFGLVVDKVAAERAGRPNDGRQRTKLQIAFASAATAHYVHGVYHERFKLRLAGRTFYTPDVVVMCLGRTTKCFEVKGFMEDDAAVKVKVAAEMYPDLSFILVTRPRREGWQCRYVTTRGISRTVWCPEWLV